MASAERRFHVPLASPNPGNDLPHVVARSTRDAQGDVGFTVESRLTLFAAASLLRAASRAHRCIVSRQGQTRERDRDGAQRPSSARQVVGAFQPVCPEFVGRDREIGLSSTRTPTATVWRPTRRGGVRLRVVLDGYGVTP